MTRRVLVKWEETFEYEAFVELPDDVEYVKDNPYSEASPGGLARDRMHEALVDLVTEVPLEKVITSHCTERDVLEWGSLNQGHEEVLAAAQDAQDASLGDSNDNEIDLLRLALGLALNELGLELPEPQEGD